MFSINKKPARGNRALLVSVADFYPGVQLISRRGAKRDTKRLHKILYNLGFQVELCNDPTAKEIHEAFRAASKKAVCDCFVGVISSHGEEGLVYGADGQAVHLAQVFRLFGEPSMEGTAKLFFVQACRGGDLDPGIEVDSGMDSRKEDSFSHLLSIPMDSAVVFATSPGYSAFMHPLGSVFLQTLCDLLEREGGRDLEVTQLLTRLNHRVAYGFEARGQLAGKKEMPCFVTRLTHQIYPFANKESEMDRAQAGPLRELGKEIRSSQERPMS